MSDDIKQTLQFYHTPGDCFEVCGIGTDRFPKSVDGGFFDNFDSAEQAALQLTKDHHAVYLTINPVDPALLGRAANRIKHSVDRTQDREITVIRRLLIDIDAERPSNVSSSDAEHAAAIELCLWIKADLSVRGWPDPLVGDSGNGAHLVYVLPDLPNVPENITLLKRCLEALAARYDTEGLHVDQKVFNPARISKVYGTWARKGDSIPERPHRLSRIISLPVIPVEVSMDLLQALADEVPKPEPRQASSSSSDGKFNLEQYLNKYGVKVKKVKPHGNSTIHILEECLFNPTHRDAQIGQQDNGMLFYKCHHNSCQGKMWSDARAVISGSDRLIEPSPSVTTVTNVTTDATVTTDTPRHTSTQNHQISSQNHDSVTTPSNYLMMLRNWLETCDEEFSVRELAVEMGLNQNPTQYAGLRKAVSRCLQEGLIAKSGKIRGIYRPRVKNIKELELSIMDANAAEFPLVLPLGLHSLASMNPKEIVLVAGENNAGKTCFLLNAVWQNIIHLSSLDLLRSRSSEDPEKIGIRYFSSESGAGVIKRSLLSFGPAYPIQRFADNVTVIGANSGFQDMLDPTGINLIDYLEAPNGDYYMIVPTITEIYKNLTTGIAIIALQKATGLQYGRGGEGTLEKPRLSLNLMKHDEMGYFTARVNKMKAPRDGIPKNGLEIDFLIENGVNIKTISNWGYEGQHKQRRKNMQPHYERLAGSPVEDESTPF